MAARKPRPRGSGKTGRVNKSGAGRPTKWTKEVIEHLADELLEWFAGDEDRFWLGDFATSHGLWRQRLDEFADASPKFSDALKIAKDIQESRLVHKGMASRSAMPIFALKNVAGWRDQQNVDVNVSGSINFVEDL